MFDRCEKRWLFLKFVKNQTEEICLEAIRNIGWALKFVKNQTEEICFEAATNRGTALRYVYFYQTISKISRIIYKHLTN